MRSRNKTVARVHTKEGMAIKVFANERTGVVLPTNWKQQAGYLAGPVVITKRLANRHERAKRERAEGYAKWKESKSWSNIPKALDAMNAREAVAHNA